MVCGRGQAAEPRSNGLRPAAREARCNPRVGGQRVDALSRAWPVGRILMAMTPHEAARWYAERNIYVFPCHTVLPNGKCSCRKPDCANQGKHPRTTHGFKDASIDLEQIDKWWGMWPDANIGVATEPSGWNAIDI